MPKVRINTKHCINTDGIPVIKETPSHDRLSSIRGWPISYDKIQHHIYIEGGSWALENGFSDTSFQQLIEQGPVSI